MSVTQGSSGYYLLICQTISVISFSALSKLMSFQHCNILTQVLAVSSVNITYQHQPTQLWKNSDILALGSTEHLSSINYLVLLIPLADRGCQVPPAAVEFWPETAIKKKKKSKEAHVTESTAVSAVSAILARWASGSVVFDNLNSPTCHCFTVRRCN